MSITQNSINLRDSIWDRVRTECADQLRACFLAVSAHQDLIAEYTKRSLLPGQAEAMIKKLTSEPLADPSPERLEAHAAIIAKLQAVVKNESIQFEARRTAGIKFMEAGPAIAAMESAVRESLEKQISELHQVEVEFFERFGLPHESTAVTRLAESLRDKVSDHTFVGGQKQIIEHPSMDYVPRLEVLNLELFRGQTR